MLSLTFFAIAVVALVVTSIHPRLRPSRVAAVTLPLGLFLVLRHGLFEMALGGGLVAFGLAQARSLWLDFDEKRMQERADEYERRLARAR